MHTTCRRRSIERGGKRDSGWGSPKVEGGCSSQRVAGGSSQVRLVTLETLRRGTVRCSIAAAENRSLAYRDIAVATKTSGVKRGLRVPAQCVHVLYSTQMKTH
jgi:hypothetical protein